MRSVPFRRALRHVHLSAGKVLADPGGILKVRLSKTCTLNVTPLNPHKFDWNHVRVSIDTPEKESISHEKIDGDLASQFLKKIGVLFTTKSHQERSHVIIEAPDLAENSSVNVELPGLFDLDIRTGSGAVNINGTIEGDVSLYCENAAVKVEKLKSMVVDIHNDGGGVSADTIQGNVTIRTSLGDICIGKMQGPSVFLSTATGDIHAGAMYVENAVIQTKDGDVRLKGVQGSTSINTVDGDAHIGGVQGSLTVESVSGDIAVQLSLPEAVSLTSQTGDISVAIPDKELNLKLQGAKIHVDPAIAHMDVVKDKNTQSIKGSYHPIGLSGDSDSDFRKDSNSMTVPKIEARSISGDLGLSVEQWGSQFTNIITRNGSKFRKSN